MKRTLALMMVLVMVLAMVVGCTKTDTNKDTLATTTNDKKTTKTEETEKSILTAPGQTPVVVDGTDITLHAIATLTDNNDDYNNNEFTKWYTKKTGVKFEFDAFPAAEAKSKINLLLNAGDLPDIILGNEIFSLPEQQIYASQNIFIPLNDLIEEQGFYTKKAFEKFPEYDIYGLFSLLDGQMYALPNLVVCYHCIVQSKMWVYQPWLDTLGIEMPETTDEFYEMLKAFKDQDPNGNGIQDEIPLAGAATGWNTKLDPFLGSAFIRNDGRNRMVVNDGKLVVSYDKDEYKESLKWINKLYTEGLIAPESFTQDNTQLKLIGGNEGVNILGCFAGGTPTQGIDIGVEDNRWLDFKAVPALEGPKGVREVPLKVALGKQSRYFITSACKYPEVAFRVGDLLYDEETFLTAQFGRKDLEWTYAAEGELGIDGKQGYMKQIKSVQEWDKNITWYQQIPETQDLTFRFGRVIENPLEKILYEASRDSYYPYASSVDTVPPDLIFDEEEAIEVVDIETSLISYVDEMTARFITGDADIDTEWDSYLNELNVIGIERYMELMQNAYDAKTK